MLGFFFKKTCAFKVLKILRLGLIKLFYDYTVLSVGDLGDEQERKGYGLANSVFVCPVDSRSIVLVGFVNFTQTQTYLGRGTVS